MLSTSCAGLLPSCISSWHVYIYMAARVAMPLQFWLHCAKGSMLECITGIMLDAGVPGDACVKTESPHVTNICYIHSLEGQTKRVYVRDSMTQAQLANLQGSVMGLGLARPRAAAYGRA